jgi:Matrixin
MKSPRSPRLNVVALEDRSLLTSFGIPWPDPGHLTISFVPDGTATPYGPSTLTQTLGQPSPYASWQQEVLRAFQTWAASANITIGVVDDDGSPLGTVGAVQGDARFGDIRIAAAPLSSTLVADAAPFSWSGTTLSGDVVFNSNYSFCTGNVASAYDIYSVALHEAGHVYGLDHSTAAGSAMGEEYGYHTGLTASDIANLRTLYGARAADPFEGPTGNNTQSRAVALPRDGILFNRFIGVGDLASMSDVDFYKFGVAPLLGITGVSVRLQASGFSLLAPRVTVFNSGGQVVASTLSVDPLNNDLSLHFAPSLLGGTYYVRVDRATADVFGVGSYRLVVDYLSLGDVLEPLGPLLSPVVDLHSNDLLGLATILSPLPKTTPDSRFDFTYRGVIEDAADVDNYKIKSPTAPVSGSLTLDVMVWALDVNGLNPRISVYDAANNAPVAFQVLANDAGIMSIQVPNASASTSYVLSIKARAGGAHSTGSYFLAADFNQFAQTTFDGVSQNSLVPAATDSAQLTVEEAAIYEFALSAQMPQAGGGQAGGVVMTVTDSSGQTVLTLSVDAGQPAVTVARYLANGSYTVSYQSRSISGQSAGTIQYNLFMLEVTDGVGPYAPGTTSPPPSGSGGSTTSSGGYHYSGSSTAKPSGNYYYF